jgi:hypothetical protein
LDYYSILHTYIHLAIHYKFTPPSSTQSIHELYTVDSLTIVLPLLFAAPVHSLSGKQRTCSVSVEGVTPKIKYIIIFPYTNMTGQDGSHSNSGGAVSAAEFQAMETQITQLMQQLQALQHGLRHAPNMEDKPDDEEHVEDDDPSALEAEAGRRAAAGGGGRGRGASRGHGAGFGNFGAPNMRPQFFGRAQRVPIGGAAGFDGDPNFGYRDDHRAGYHGHRGGYDDRGGGGHFGAFGDHQFARDDGHRNRHRGVPERRQGEDGLGKVKVSIPTFNGKENADSYYEWETKVEQIFDLYDYPAEKKQPLNSKVMPSHGGIKSVQNIIVWDMFVSLGET